MQSDRFGLGRPRVVPSARCRLPSRRSDAGGGLCLVQEAKVVGDFSRGAAVQPLRSNRILICFHLKGGFVLLAGGG